MIYLLRTVSAKICRIVYKMANIQRYYSLLLIINTLTVFLFLNYYSRYRQLSTAVRSPYSWIIICIFLFNSSQHIYVCRGTLLWPFFRIEASPNISVWNISFAHGRFVCLWINFSAKYRFCWCLLCVCVIKMRKKWLRTKWNHNLIYYHIMCLLPSAYGLIYKYNVSFHFHIFLFGMTFWLSRYSIIEPPPPYNIGVSNIQELLWTKKRLIWNPVSHRIVSLYCIDWIWGFISILNWWCRHQIFARKQTKIKWRTIKHQKKTTKQLWIGLCHKLMTQQPNREWKSFSLSKIVQSDS